MTALVGRYGLTLTKPVPQKVARHCAHTFRGVAGFVDDRMRVTYQNVEKKSRSGRIPAVRQPLRLASPRSIERQSRGSNGDPEAMSAFRNVR
jgi:hypothetical protein